MSTTVLLDPASADPDDRGDRLVDIADTILVRLPRAFYADHVARDLIAGNVEREDQRVYFVRLDRAAYDELISDAESMIGYSRMGAYGPEMFGLVQSAKATVRRLLDASTPWAD